MSGNVVRLGSTQPSEDKRTLLEVLDTLRQSIEAGETVAFVAVGIESSDCTRMWKCGPGVSNLRMHGAAAVLARWCDEE